MAKTVDLAKGSGLADRKDKKFLPLFYAAAFFIPVILTLIAYAFFGVYPFGERSALALDLNAQYIYYFEALRDAFWGDGSVFYSWARNLSGGFMGIIGYYLASPLSLIMILLPRTMILESLLIMQLCKLGCAGLTFFYYARTSKGAVPAASLLFSIMYAMMGYAVIQLIDPMWLDGVILLPLIALGVEHLIDDGRRLGYIIPLAVMFFANFYIGFMIAIFTAIYFFVYLFFCTDRKFKSPYDYAQVLGRMAVSTIVVLMCSAIMILPVYNALALGKFDFSGKPDYSFAYQFNLLELVPTLLPNQYYSVDMPGKPEIYCGVLTAVLLPLFFMNSRIKSNRKIGYGLVILILIFSMIVRPVDMMWHGGQTPNWLPYRYSFILAFVFVSMGVEIFSKLDGYALSWKPLCGVFAGLGLLLYIFDAKSPEFAYDQSRFRYVAGMPYRTTEGTGDDIHKELWLGTIAFGLLLAAFYLVMLWLYTSSKNTGKKRILAGVMTAVVCFEVCYNAYDSFKKIDKEVYYSSGASYYNEIQGGIDTVNELEKYDGGMYRSEKTFSRCVNDNLAMGLKGVSHSSSVMNTRAINFLETMGYSMRSYVTAYDGNTSLADSLLGIKYVLDEPNKSEHNYMLNPNYQYRFTHDYINNDNQPSKMDVYENPDALSIGYMVSEDVFNLAFLGNDNPFNSQNMFLSTFTGNTQFTKTPEVITIDGNREYYTRIPESVTYNDCTESDYSGQRCFTANANAVDPIVNVHVTAQSEQEIYMYFSTFNEKAVNLWISTEKDANGNFINHQALGANKYYEDEDYSMLRVGSFDTGTDIEIRMTIRKNPNSGVDAYTGDNEYVMVKDFFVYHFNYDLFKQDVDILKQNQWNITGHSDRYLYGTITAQENQIMFTSIPSEPGWTVRVDGKKVETKDILNAFIGIPLEAGEHTVSMKYTPPGFVTGVVTLVLGIGVIVMFYIDEKRRKLI